MNRRELLAAAGTALAGLGTVKSIESEPMPLALVVTFPIDHEAPTQDQVRRIKAQIEKLFQGSPKMPIIVCSPGMNVLAMPIQNGIMTATCD